MTTILKMAAGKLLHSLDEATRKNQHGTVDFRHSSNKSLLRKIVQSTLVNKKLFCAKFHNDHCREIEKNCQVEKMSIHATKISDTFSPEELMPAKKT